MYLTCVFKTIEIKTMENPSQCFYFMLHILLEIILSMIVISLWGYTMMFDLKNSQSKYLRWFQDL